MNPITTELAPEYLAKELCRNFQEGHAPSETELVGMFNEWMQGIVVAENTFLLNELTNLAFKETDSGKKAGYFKLARLIQSRLSQKNIKSSLPEPALS